jgi:type VI secretion system protein ImpG
MTFLQTDAAMLDELRKLESWRSRYQMEHPGMPLGPEDPDVRRLIEALAYSGVRTRQLLLRNLQATWRRLLSSYFSFILQPLPAMALAQAVVTARMSETAVLPRGTMLRLTTLDGFAGDFQTLAELRVVPMTLANCEVRLRAQGFRLILSFVSQYRRGDDVGLLRLHLHYLDNYLAALRVQANLQRHLQRCIAVYDTSPTEDTDGLPCEVHFGAHYDEPYEADAQNPLARARDFFHFPDQDLSLNVRVPPAPRAWNQLSLCFDLDADWPREPPVYREIFKPFTVPVKNLRRSMAQPIDCDGTQDAYPIRYPLDDRSFALQRVIGVYRATAAGMEPLRAAALADIQPSYELEEPAADGPSGNFLVVRMPEAFAKPERLLVDGAWYQPEFTRHAIGPIQAGLLERNVLGLSWQTIGSVRPSFECMLQQDPERLLSLLSLKTKPVLEREDLLELLNLFGSVDLSAYRQLPQRLKHLSVEVVPDGRLQGAGIRHIYHANLQPPEREEAPLLERFLSQLERILDAWDYEAAVELRVNTGNDAVAASTARARTKERLR